MNLFSETLPLTLTDQGQGRNYLLLHGGAGPLTMTGLASALSQNGRVVVPTHPGFNGQPRPEWFRQVSDLATAYLTLIEKLEMTDVVLVGNSMGGWIAAEMALRHSPRIAGTVLLNAVGIDTGSPDKKIGDPTSVPPPQRLALSYHNPEKFAVPLTEALLAILAENQRHLRTYAGDTMYDATLRPRLSATTTPTLVVWGESDQIVDIDYGQLFARSIPGARFELVREAGHFPHIEQLDQVVGLVEGFWRR